MRKIYFYPVWLRIWHLLNALLMLLLILSGISMHYSATSSLLFPFKTGMLIHNISGILLTINYIFYFIMNIISGNIKYYVPIFKRIMSDLWIQAKYYLLDIFARKPHPFKINEKRKFNPLQQITYLGVMYFLVPIIILSGWALLFPELAPDEILGMGGVWPMAIIHAIVGFFLTIFMVGHIYLGTTGEHPSEYFQAMITGYHIVHNEQKEEIIAPQFEETSEQTYNFSLIFKNPITIAGGTISVISFTLIIVLAIIDLFRENPNPLMSTINYIILPVILFIGLILMAIGAILKHRSILKGNEVT